ncbi:MAG: RidA family protein [Dehalococcoidia bacterium]
MEKKLHNPWTWQDNLGFAQAVEISGHKRVVRCAGQTSVDADGAPMHEGDMAAQIGQALNNLETVLKSAGMTFANIARLNIYTTDVDLFLASYGAMIERLAGNRAASTLLGVARLAFPPLMVEIEATAVE